MKRIQILSIVLVLGFTCLNAQDQYHNNIQSTLAQEYNATGGAWLFSDNEIDNNNTDLQWGADISQAPINGQIFSSSILAEVEMAGQFPWDAGIFNKSQVAIGAGDLIFCTFFARTTNGPGKTSVIIEHETTFEKEFFFEANLPSEWTQFFIKFVSQDDYEIGELNFGFQFGTDIKTIQIGGFTALNFGTNATFDQLPIDIHNDKYGGYEIDAPWRSEAAQRIEDLRTAQLTIEAVDENGQAIQNGSIDVRMQEHEFHFGTAAVACRFAENSCHNETYQSKLENLDGEGKGFNMIVFENDTKWPNWENEYSQSTRAEVVKATTWASERSIDVRGHTLVWPGNSTLPDDVAASDDIDYISERINGHIESILNYPGIKDNIIEWDVLNEIVTNRDLEARFAGQANFDTGRELYKLIFDKAKAEAPEIKLFLNDFVTLSVNDGPTAGFYMQLKEFLEELIDDGAPVEGLGFQGHIGTFPNSILDVEATLDDFYNSFGLPAKITEFDLPDTVSEELAAQYLRDFMTMVFSHPSMEGFLFWSFWDGATYKNPGANLFRQDWSMTPAGDAFVDLLFEEWWTDEQAEIENGLASLQAYKGRYEIAYQCNGVLVEEEIELTSDTTLQIVCDNLSTLVIDDFTKRYAVFPNPSTGEVKITRNATKAAELQVFNPLGQLILSKEVSGSETSVQIDQAGLYTLTLDGHSKKVLIQ